MLTAAGMRAPRQGQRCVLREWLEGGDGKVQMLETGGLIKEEDWNY